MVRERIYISHDNIVMLKLTTDSDNLTQDQYDAITRMTLDFGGVIVDSDIVGEGATQPFDWTSDRKLILDLGKLSTAIIAKHYDSVKHIVYSPDNPNGLVWGYLDILVA